MDLPDRIKLARESLGLNQKDMATALGASLPSVQNYEAGKSVPGGDVIKAFVKLGFNANWLLTGDGEMRREGKPAVHDAMPGWEPTNGHPASRSTPDAPERPLSWFYEWLEDELKDKSVTEIMRFAVKIKAELDKGREG